MTEVAPAHFVAQSCRHFDRVAGSCSRRPPAAPLRGLGVCPGAAKRQRPAGVLVGSPVRAVHHRRSRPVLRPGPWTGAAEAPARRGSVFLFFVGAPSFWRGAHAIAAAIRIAAYRFLTQDSRHRPGPLWRSGCVHFLEESCAKLFPRSVKPFSYGAPVPVSYQQLFVGDILSCIEAPASWSRWQA
ncbi:unnamed protein product [Amoebophrya sp. A120]|nr:unnamed protein product [Amoebophrya sp. A120]|eukprot:GSA120T00008931001.1